MSENVDKIDLISKTPSQRKKFLEEEIQKLPNLPNIESELQKGKKVEQLLKKGIKIEEIISQKTISPEKIRGVFKKFEEDFIDYIPPKLANPKPSVYTLSDTSLLARANTFSRELSTKLGDVWENVAFLSPKVISMEKIFDNFKIRGVDIIIINESEFCFCQIKTAKSTLTGSQRPRSESELKIFEKSKFVAALNLGNWTFNSDVVPRIAGKEFWDLIDIEYDEIIEHTKDTISSMEKYFKNKPQAKLL